MKQQIEILVTKERVARASCCRRKDMRYWRGITEINGEKWTLCVNSQITNSPILKLRSIGVCGGKDQEGRRVR